MSFHRLRTCLLQLRASAAVRLLRAGCADSVTDLALVSCAEVAAGYEAVRQVREHHAAGWIGPCTGSAATAGLPEGLEAGHAAHRGLLARPQLESVCPAHRPAADAIGLSLGRDPRSFSDRLRREDPAAVQLATAEQYLVEAGQVACGRGQSRGRDDRLPDVAAVPDPGRGPVPQATAGGKAHA